MLFFGEGRKRDERTNTHRRVGRKRDERTNGQTHIGGWVENVMNGQTHSKNVTHTRKVVLKIRIWVYMGKLEE